MEIKKKFGLAMARARRERGITQEQLADLAGIARSYCSDVERGVRNPTITIVERIAKALDVSMGDLLD